MPILNDINHEQRCIYTSCTGLMSAEDFNDYIARIWSTDAHFGYNELFDTTQADWSQFDFVYLFEVAKAASLLTTIDPNSRLAWVVTEGKDNELTAFYKQARLLASDKSRELEAFFSREEALNWLGIL